jgi:hypothetical protein
LEQQPFKNAVSQAVGNVRRDEHKIAELVENPTGFWNKLN